MQRYEIAAVIAAIQARHDLKSQPAVARHMGIAEKTLSNWLHHRNFPDVAACMQLAELAGLDAEILTAYNQALRAPNEESRQCWMRVVGRLIQGERPANFAVPGAPKTVAPIAVATRAPGTSPH